MLYPCISSGVRDRMIQADRNMHRDAGILRNKLATLGLRAQVGGKNTVYAMNGGMNGALSGTKTAVKDSAQGAINSAWQATGDLSLSRKVKPLVVGLYVSIELRWF